MLISEQEFTVVTVRALHEGKLPPYVQQHRVAITCLWRPTLGPGDNGAAAECCCVARGGARSFAGGGNSPFGESSTARCYFRMRRLRRRSWRLCCIPVCSTISLCWARSGRPRCT